MRNIFALSLLLICSLFSCKTETIQCNPAGAKVYFIGYSNNEVNKITIYEYKKDNQFDTLIDSIPSYCMQQGTSDTMMMLHVLDDDHDYKVKLLQTNTTCTITGLTVGNHYTDKYQHGLVNDLVLRTCINNTISYTLNGQQFGQPNVMTGVYNVVYVSK